MTKEDIRDFYELRVGLLAMHGTAAILRTFADAALRFLDAHGIAMTPKTPSPARRVERPRRLTTRRLATIREKVKRHYTQRRAATAPTTRPPKRSKAERRQESAAILAQLDPVEPRMLTGTNMQHLGALARRGYAKKKGDGYVRTGKVFVVTKSKKPDRQDTTPATDGSGGDVVTAAEAATVLKMSPTHVRKLIKQKELKGRIDHRPRRGGHTPMPLLVIDRAELARFIAERTATTQ